MSPAAHRSFADHRGHRDLARATLEVDDVGLDAFVDAAARIGQHFVERVLELGDSAPPDRDRRNNRDAQFAFEHIGVELEPIASGEIDHVERRDRR